MTDYDHAHDRFTLAVMGEHITLSVDSLGEKKEVGKC